MAELTYREAVAAGISQELERDETVVFLGEDIAKAGGVLCRGRKPAGTCDAQGSAGYGSVDRLLGTWSRHGCWAIGRVQATGSTMGNLRIAERR